MSAALLSPVPVFSSILCMRISLLLQWLHSHQCPRISSIRLCTSFSSACILANTLASTLCAHRAKTPDPANYANIYLTRASLLSDEKKGGKSRWIFHDLRADRLCQVRLDDNGNVYLTDLDEYVSGCCANDARHDLDATMLTERSWQHATLSKPLHYCCWRCVWVVYSHRYRRRMSCR